MLQKLKPLASVLVIVVVTLLVNNVASALGLNNLLAPGTTRYAVVNATSNAYINSTAFVNLDGLSTSITIPSGKHGDVMVFFCGEALSDSFMKVQAMIGSTAMAPGEVQLRGNALGSESQCVNFSKPGVVAGSKTIRMQWRGTTMAQQQMFKRSMIVIVNVH